ncbi:GNAT family protein [Alkalihalobacillus sp. LMS39]|uniref:GNAT family N-acetyltransferase n=1 Tax=Alkalihalobacillus sp. LMS39 TaxID=2924032 RepID=UPI001FB20DA3|nr:GNAT family protein [Alkalihalobacillus sp. LMS39]UOE93241.1 GNAT family N-acetyltransferase [Alkalihalobacillus sp. LMS39]
MLTFKKLNKELDELVAFYTTNSWAFHAFPTVSKAEIINYYHSRWYEEDKETYWIKENKKNIGLLIISDISDTIPLLFDVRLTNNGRGKGYGEQAVKWAVNHVFTRSNEKIRIEGYTRHDNYAMRKVFSKCNFQKEGYLRKAWENADGSVEDSLVYAIIRTDWERGTKTPININDVPF